jgi:molybdopterin-guanine dinucleotide biosynthesis protein MobB
VKSAKHLGATPLLELLKTLEEERKSGASIVFTNGCFDLIHPGHVSYLAEAKSLGDILIVGVNSDASVKRLEKGSERPILNETERSTILTGLASVDYAVIFDEETPLKLIEKVKPNLLVKGGDWALGEIVGRDIVERLGGEVRSIKFIEGNSTTSIVGRIQKALESEKKSGVNNETPALSFIAKSKTGKTTILEKVIKELTGRGYRVGSIKHHPHDFDIDKEGKDSYRLTRAGASPMVISSPEKLALIDAGRENELSLLEITNRFMGEVDLLITEGYKKENLPKIEIHRGEKRAALISVSEKGEILDPLLIAVISDTPKKLEVPVFDLNNPTPICDFIVERFLKK